MSYGSSFTEAFTVGSTVLSNSTNLIMIGDFIVILILVDALIVVACVCTPKKKQLKTAKPGNIKDYDNNNIHIYHCRQNKNRTFARVV